MSTVKVLYLVIIIDIHHKNGIITNLGYLLFGLLRILQNPQKTVSRSFLPPHAS